MAGRVGDHSLYRGRVSYSRIILGKSNADFLGLIDRKPFRALVVVLAVANQLMEHPVVSSLVSMTCKRSLSLAAVHTQRTVTAETPSTASKSKAASRSAVRGCVALSAWTFGQMPRPWAFPPGTSNTGKHLMEDWI